MDWRKLAGGAAATILALLIGFMFLGPQVAKKKTSEDVLNLPAVVEKVNSNQQDLKDYKIQNQAQIDRREGEMVTYVDRLDNKKRERVELEIRRVDSLRDLEIAYEKRITDMQQDQLDYQRGRIDKIEERLITKGNK